MKSKASALRGTLIGLVLCTAAIIAFAHSHVFGSIAQPKQEPVSEALAFASFLAFCYGAWLVVASRRRFYAASRPVSARRLVPYAPANPDPSQEWNDLMNPLRLQGFGPGRFARS